MSRRSRGSWVVLLCSVVACSGTQPSAADVTGRPSAALQPTAAGQSSTAGQPIGTNPSDTSATAPGTPPLLPSAAAAGHSATAPVLMSPGAAQPVNCSLTEGPFKPEGCSCSAGQTAACWTGPVADRNVGACHDGLQLCEGTSEFASWGPCKGEQQSCGVDAGVPDDEDCSCVPGAIIQCSEDCSVGIICSLTATKTCLPDGTWSTCHEEADVQLDAPGFQCRNMLHGCLDVLSPDGTGQGQGEVFVGDCSKQFKCGHAPPPPPDPEPPQ